MRQQELSLIYYLNQSPQNRAEHQEENPKIRAPINCPGPYVFEVLVEARTKSSEDVSDYRSEPCVAFADRSVGAAYAAKEILGSST